ncbi:thermonuclease family protein [Acidovorax sp. ACV02]|uniref:thermonuclease family protein n=1 Tax=Acidovorax sp. ACV02 TaxID=2769310 RepID=UPI001785389B|nr:thermonuclease family protein [Acidovorax sp. ACV02]MBD9406255.1 thermonuclease family protein [Acidovorax sp. ACV02]
MHATLLCLVIAITDGDTLTARCGEPGSYEQVTIRISAIDAPEKRQAFGQVSRQHLAQLCFEQVATITPRTHDRYGRTVGDVECQGQDVATEQVHSGMAWFYVKYGKGYEHLRGLEAEAREARRGLWAQEAVAPWDWRRPGHQSQIKSGPHALSATGDARS